MKHAPSQAEQDYLADTQAGFDPSTEELARIAFEIESAPQQIAAELLKLRALRLVCQSKRRRLPDAVKKAVDESRPPSIREFLENQPELQS
jgi:hypothetical protein